MFTQNLIFLGVENILMAAIPQLFTTEMVVSMKDSLAAELCEEPIGRRQIRRDKKLKLDRLQKGLALCQNWGKTCKGGCESTLGASS